MPLQAGSRLGPYELTAPIGAGGMGEVWRGRDTRLARDVAVKVLPAGFPKDEQFRARFEREARTISSLNHPHICTLFDVGEQDGTHFLVMELLEGETLADRLQKGPLPLEQVVRWGAQIADALERAHRQGVVHRDLKPGNVVLTRTGAKLLDFGLARSSGAAAAASGSTETATEVRPLTTAGTVLGTFQYMAPEQLEGAEADARADIFALGAVLYEMATGRPAFEGKNRASLIAAILSSEPPPISQVATMTPPALDRVVRTCLAKDPEERWQSAGDVAKELRWIAEGSVAGVAAPALVTSRRRHRERLSWALALVAVAAATGLGLSLLRPAAPRANRVLRTHILLPEKVRLNVAAIAPDGGRIAFSGIDQAGKVQLWVRTLDTYLTTPLAGTEGGTMPFWSPDGRFIAFFADRKLKRVEASGGPPIVLHDVDGVSGAWAPNGDIVFTAASGPVLRLASGGGKPVPVTRVDAAARETTHRYPFFLPDGRHFLYLALNAAGNSRDPANRIWVGSLDGSPPRPVIQANHNAQYADGFLLFIRGGDLGGSLLAQPFDPSRLATSGEAVTLAEQVSLYGAYLGMGDYSVSREGTLIFDAFRLQTRLEWFDRTGKQTGTFGEPAPHFNPRISPDGSRIAFDLYETGTQTNQVWVGDVARGIRSRLTSAPSSNAGPVWSPDGSRIAFQSDRKHQADVFVRPANGSGVDEAMTDSESQSIPQDWSADGRFIVCLDREGTGDRLMQLSILPVAPPGKPRTLLPRAANDFGSASVSTDGRWVAYDLDESGRREVYVASVPDGQGKVQVSSAGGVGPRWTRGGRELLYTAFDGKVMAVEIDARRGLRAGTPRPLFELPEGAFSWDVSADGERFLVNVPVIKSSSVPLSMIVNWAAGLRR
jgi:Tol biopolymer transport system component